MTLPFLLSVPHAGLKIPDEVERINLLSPQQIAEDGDEGAAEIYDLKDHVTAVVTTEIARAYVDLNRAEDDRRKDGIVKTHTCWDVKIYSEPLPENTVQALLKKYYRPYHEQLTHLSLQDSVKLGIDCHTMAVVGPPVGPDPGIERPLICLSNGDQTCPAAWLSSLAGELENTFGARVSINVPFRGGYIIRSHSRELPWIQIEFARTGAPTNPEKRNGLLQALQAWYAGGLDDKAPPLPRFPGTGPKLSSG